MGSYKKEIEEKATNINHIKILKFIKSNKCIFDIELLDFIDNSTAKIFVNDSNSNENFLIKYREDLQVVDFIF